MMRGGRRVSTQEVAGRLRATLGVDATVDPADAAERARQAANVPVVSPAARARTPGQQRYLECMDQHDVVFGVGPAGTGKTYLAVAKAIEAMKRGAVRRLVLVRPAVEAGEKLGFLPGDLQQKIDPYLRPMYDALQDLLDPRTRMRWLESEVVEVCPLAYMRGRTLNRAFVILDEAQNTTVPQMLMFLTRLGEGSRMVVTGDPSQTDLPHSVQSGLGDALRKLDGVDGIGITRLDSTDVVRHAVVSRIVNAYDAAGHGQQRPR
jgi:phosphate starvation-inducible PhoH-like protein